MGSKLVVLTAFFLFISTGIQAQIIYPDSATVQLGTDELFWDFDTRKTDVNPNVSYGPDGGVTVFSRNDSVFMRFGAPEYTIVYKAKTLNDLKGGGNYEVVSAGETAGNYPGSNDPNPGNFDYKIWPSANGNTGANSFLGNDGNLYRVQYQEFLGWEIDSLVTNNICPDPNVVTSLEGGLEKCWYNGFVLTKSTDGGDTWALASSDQDNYVVASSPYKLQEQNNTTRHGVFPWNNADSFSRVFKVGSYYYFPVQFWTQDGQISTIMRTDDISDASSWRYWDGSDFTIPNVNPYYDVITDPESHLPPPIENSGYLHFNDAKATVEGITYSSYFGKYIRTQIRAYNSNPEIIPGVYFHLSDDGFNWSGPQLLYRLSNASELNNGVELGGRSENFAYPVLVDQTNPGSDTLGQSAWLFYVTFNPANTGNADRNIRRVQVDFATHSVTGFTVTHTNLNLPEDANPGDGYCDNGYGRCSVITAINESNQRPPWVAASEELVIEFGNSLSGVITEDYASTVTKKIVIDGTTHSSYVANTNAPTEGWNATLPFEIESGLNFQGSGHLVKGVHISSISVGSESDTSAVRIIGSRIDTLNLYGTTETPSVIGGQLSSEANLLGSVTMFGNADTLTGNLIGMDGTGSAIIDPGVAFITIQNAGNVISNNVMGNTNYRGINISNGDGNLITNNVIGFAPWDGSDKGTGGAGISVGSSNNTILGNVIGFTKGEAAIYMDNQSGNTIAGNYIGVDQSGNDRGNSVAGIWLAGGSSNNIIGTSDGSSPNTIANNTGAGVDFNVATGSGNTVTGNLIFNNEGGAIANYSHIQIAEPPKVYSVFKNSSADSLFLYFTDIDTLIENGNNRVELFLTSDSASEGQGNEYLGGFDIDIQTSPEMEIVLPNGIDFGTYPKLSLTVTGSSGNTSYYSTPRNVLDPTQTPIVSFSRDTISTIHNDQTRIEGVEVKFYNTGNEYLDWFFDNEQAWAFTEPNNGILAAGDSVTIGITLDSRDFSETDLLSDVFELKSNYVNNPIVELPVEIDLSSISAEPMISFGMDTLNLTYQKEPGNKVYTESFYMHNLGVSGLAWRLSKNQPWMGNINPISGTLSENDSVEVSMDISINGGMQTGIYQGILVAFGSYGGGSETAFELFVTLELIDDIPPPLEPTIQIMGEDSLSISVDSIQVQFEVANFIVGPNPETSNGKVKVFLNDEELLQRTSTDAFYVHNLQEGLNSIILQLFKHDNMAVISASDTLWVDVSQLVSNNEESVIPNGFALSQNYPNPFNPSTLIRYDIPVSSKVEISVYDALGRRVSVLLDAYKSPGSYDLRFDASGLNSGIYFYRIEAGGFVKTRKMTLIK
tara:strand:- start:654 stop:4685 length:4032 start_codon:yes stop_codon:yes gene_type:complete